MEDFADLVLLFVREFGGSKGAFAHATGMSSSQLSRLLRPDSPVIPSIEQCLHIAKVAHAAPGRLLRAAKHADIADLLEELYGPSAERRLAKEPVLKPYESQMLREWRGLLINDQRTIAYLIGRLAKIPRRRRQQSAPKSPSEASDVTIRRRFRTVHPFKKVK